MPPWEEEKKINLQTKKSSQTFTILHVIFSWEHWTFFEREARIGGSQNQRGWNHTVFNTSSKLPYLSKKTHPKIWKYIIFATPHRNCGSVKEKNISLPQNTHTQRKKKKQKNNNPSPRKWWPFSSTWRFAVWTSPENRRRFGIVVLLQMSRGDFFRGKSLYFLKCFVEF